MAFVGKGTQIQINTTGETFVSIARVVSVTGPNATVDTVEATHLMSVAKEFLPCMSDWGEVSFTIQYDPEAADHETHGMLTDLISAPAVKDWKILFPNGTVYPFEAMLTGFAIQGVEVSGIVTADVTLKVSGNIEPE